MYKSGTFYHTGTSSSKEAANSIKAESKELNLKTSHWAKMG